MTTIPDRCVLCAHLKRYYPIGIDGRSSYQPSYKCDIEAYGNTDSYCKYFKLKQI